MAQASVVGDPEEIKAFARQLTEYCQLGREQLGQVAGRLREMGQSSWQDRQYQAFQEDFDQMAGQLERAFATLADEHAPRLHELAGILDEYRAKS